MFYKFNGFAGRIVAASNLQTPLFPLRTLPLYKNAPPVVYDKTVKLSTVASQTVCGKKSRKIPGTDSEYSPLTEEMIRKREIFQADNDIPVHLKGGPTDKILYYTTFALIGVGIISMMEFFLRSINPKKPE